MLWLLLIYTTLSFAVTYDAGLIIVSFGRLKQENYENIISEIKSLFPVNLGVFVVDETDDLSMAREHAFRNGVDRSAPLFLLGHSVKASANAQYHGFSHADWYSGIILYGAQLLPKFRSQKDLPILGISGEQDGVFKPMRTAEAFYHMGTTEVARLNHPVVFLQGLNHASLLSDHPMHTALSHYDLKQTVSSEKATQIVAQIITAFMIGNDRKQNFESKYSLFAASYLLKAVSDSEDLLMPLIRALELEANPRIKKPCDVN